ncbi:uncharacterized protein LOC132729485 [Ruditapes philippinarum]|uniref:uncharacterized protein LOC132729485 n=1 Tax=Ruditapes philippinarum TaxID=129788 RepID=UPI00295AEF98|nr:uncharacterized protein LOC132729485 [Ruditapes philippinarum]
MKLAREENIILGELPSHTSNWTQPFDRAVFKSLKTAWNAEVDDFVKQTGISLGHAQFLRIFGKAWKSSIRSDNIVSGFKATGILPFNPEAIPEAAFAPSDLQNQHHNTITHPEPDSEAAVAVSSASLTSVSLLTESEGTPLQENSSDPFLPTVYDINIENELTNENAVQVIDLPLTLNLENQDDNMEDMEDQNLTVVSDKKALKVIESALSPDTLAKYCAAYLSGIALNDKLYETWKMYKSKINDIAPKEATAVNKVMEDMFPLPKPANAKKAPAKRKHTGQNYFVITADEVYMEKLNCEEEKKRKSIEKENRKQERERKRLLKAIDTQNKAKKKQINKKK